MPGDAQADSQDRQLTMRWPWQRPRDGDLVVASWVNQTFSHVRARARSDGKFEVVRFGVEKQGADSPADFGRRLESRGLKGCTARMVLRPQQYQFLQIEAPGVAPDELRSAARYQIRDMVNVHIDDVTLDVMRVGDGQNRGTAHLFVVAAHNADLQAAAELATSLRWSMPVIDVQETAQRNLQSLIASDQGTTQRANAALVLVGQHQAILTICANDELFYTRRLDVPQGFLDGPWDGAAHAEPQAYAPVGEYVPDYGVAGVSYGSDYSAPAAATSGGGASADAAAHGERAQRFLVEVQRSLDLWDRSWSNMPLAAVRVFAGQRSVELARWLTQELGQPVAAMEVGEFFPGFDMGNDPAMVECWPLLGHFMRIEQRKL